MSNRNQIISCQIGNFSNFIGSHFWNLQMDEDIDGSVTSCNAWSVFHEEKELYKGSSSTHYVPRLQVIGPKNALGFFEENRSQINLVQDASASDRNPANGWSGTVQTYNQAPYETHDFQKAWRQHMIAPGLNRSVGTRHVWEKFDYWTDFKKYYLNNNSVLNLPYNNYNEDLYYFPYGAENTSKQNIDELIDDLRTMSEACDYLDGFNFVIDASTELSGLASMYLDEWRDEYPKNVGLVWAVTQPLSDRRENMKEEQLKFFEHTSSVNLSWMTAAVQRTNCHLIPVADPYRWRLNGLNIESHNFYESSAVAAATMNLIFDPLRSELQESALNLSSLAGFWRSTSSVFISCAEVSLPLPFQYMGELTRNNIEPWNNASFLSNITLPLLQDKPGLHEPRNVVAEMVVFRGLLSDRTTNDASFQRKLEDKMSFTNPEGRNQKVFHRSNPVAVVPPFPLIFKPEYEKYIRNWKAPDSYNFKSRNPLSMASMGYSCTNSKLNNAWVSECVKNLKNATDGHVKWFRDNSSAIERPQIEEVIEDLESAAENMLI